MDLPPLLDLAMVRELYGAGGWTPAALLTALGKRIDGGDPAAFITRAPALSLATQIDALLARAPVSNSLPLWGVPFAVKDNIDVAGMPTTCACPAFGRLAERDAACVAALVAAGAIVIGKTNLDQFATGLNGTRSPYGAPRSVFSAEHISGGSSSGSAVAVASGCAAFALGTDTAGSGRVPAAFNNIVGIKPTPGLVRTAGLVPACRSLDCISIFTLSVADGAVVRRLIEGYDPADSYARQIAPRALPAASLKVGVLAAEDRDFCGSDDNARLYELAIEQLGAEPIEIDFAPFREVAALLYEGPWVAERLAAFEDTGLAATDLDPAVRTIVSQARGYSAVDAFRGAYRLEELRAQCAAQWQRMDVLLLPTAPRLYTVAQMLADPIRLNSKLGLYTNFFNLLGLAGIAVPAGFAADGLPFGVTLAAPGGTDEALVPLADRLHRAAQSGSGPDRGYVPATVEILPAGPERLEIAVIGAHLSGMAMNHELVALGGEWVGAARTLPDYRLFLVPGTVPPKPGLVQAPGHAGPGIEVEVWSLPAAAFGTFVSRIPSPLGIGKIVLADGSHVSGFLCEAWAVDGAREITAFGGWRAFLAKRTLPAGG